MFQEDVDGIPVLWHAPDPSIDQGSLVIWLAGFGGTKESCEPQLRDLAGLGFTALSIDAWQHGTRRIESEEDLRARVRGNIRRWFWPILHRTARDVVAVLDWSESRFGLRGPVGMGGVSMGGDIAVAAAGMDKRIAAVSAAIATPDWLRPGSFEPPGMPDAEAWKAYRDGNPLSNLDRYAHCPAMAFECGDDDRQVPPDGAERFCTALAETYRAWPERLRVTRHAGVAHRFAEAMWLAAMDWFDHHLNGADETA